MGVFKRVRKSKDGSKSVFWYDRFSINGRETWKSLGRVGEITKTVAQRRSEEIRRKIRMGIYEYEDKNITLENIESDYIKYVKEIKMLRTWEQRKMHLKSLMTFFHGKRLIQITPKDIEDYKSFRLRNLKPASINRELATLRHLFNLSKRWKMYYGENPVSVSGLLREDNQRDRVLSPEEEERLFASSSPHLKSILIAALNTGMRKGELLSLQWSNVDFDNSLIIITPTNNKSKKVKKIPINSYLRKFLLEMKLKNGANSESVFLGDSGEPVKDIKTAFNNACRRAKIKDLTFHDLRRTAGTRMLELGVGIVAISEVLGHSSIEVTRKRYLQPNQSLREAVEKLGNFNKSCSQIRSHENRDHF